MSFEVKLVNGDLEIAPQGDVTVISGTEKLAQDLLKIIHTVRGTDPYKPTYGVTIVDDIIGTANHNPNQLEGKIEENILEAIAYMQGILAIQSKSQYVSPAEQPIDLTDLVVEIDEQDPRIIKIKALIITAALTEVDLSFSLNRFTLT